MKRLIFAFSAILILVSSAQVVHPQATQAAAQADLAPSLQQAYESWRAAMVSKNAHAWEAATASYRRMEVRNRIVSEKRAFPAAVFDTPAPPPMLRGMKLLEAKQKAATAKASYFGKLDFGNGPMGGDNLLVLSFVSERGKWLYDRADVVNLAALPDVRKELAAGNLKYLNETPEAQPTGRAPVAQLPVRPAKTIAKVYAFCPGREVNVRVNKISAHRFANTKEAEIVIGGANDGPNEISYSVRKLEGGTGKEAMTIRVYLFSQVQGVKPLKVFEYQVKEGEAAQAHGKGTFAVDQSVLQKLAGK